jgi:small subunit ribosomal protein S9
MSTTPAYHQGTGRRKTAVARVRLIAGEGQVVVNGRTLEEHFGNAVSLSDIMMPFRVTNTEGRFNAMVKVEGGGSQGQAGAIRHGIARALLESDPEGARTPLRQAGFLTRDPRMKERKKYGLKRARKAPQYTKR